MSAPAVPCPCGSGAELPACCGRWHSGPERLRAPDAQALMRSRYSAYTLGLQGYLLDTWHPSTRPDTLEPMPADLKWMGLEIRRFAVMDASSAIVEFVARSKRGGRAHRLHETSRFSFEAGQEYAVRAPINTRIHEYCHGENVEHG